MLTEEKCREMRLDKVEFKTFEDAVRFGVNNKIHGRSIYKYPSGYCKILIYTKGANCEKIGTFVNGNFEKEDLNKKIPVLPHSSTRKQIDVKKLTKFFYDHPEINKYTIGPAIYRSRSLINDICRRGIANIVLMDAVCDLLNVPKDYFDFVEETEEVEEVEAVEEVKEETESDHDILVSLLLSQKKIEALLMEIVQKLK